MIIIIKNGLDKKDYKTMQQINCKKTLSSFALATLLVAVQVSAEEYPGDFCCEFWVDANYGGASIKKCYDHDVLGNNGTLISVLPGGFSGNIESWSCGKNVQYDFCYNNDDDCTGGSGEGGAGTNNNAVKGHANWLARIFLTYYDDAERPAVTTFTGPDCTDLSGRFEAPNDRNGKAKYNINEIFSHGHMSNDFMSAIKIPSGLTVDLSKEGDFTGEILNLTGSWIADHHTMWCYNLSEFGFDKVVSSLTVSYE